MKLDFESGKRIIKKVEDDERVKKKGKISRTLKNILKVGAIGSLIWGSAEKAEPKSFEQPVSPDAVTGAAMTSENAQAYEDKMLNLRIEAGEKMVRELQGCQSLEQLVDYYLKLSPEGQKRMFDNFKMYLTEKLPGTQEERKEAEKEILDTLKDGGVEKKITNELKEFFGV
jgi:hypothetical protein